MVAIEDRSTFEPLAPRNTPSITTSVSSTPPSTQTTTTVSLTTDTPSSTLKGSHWSAGDIAALVILVVFALVCVIGVLLWRLKVRRRQRRLTRDNKVTEMMHAMDDAFDESLNGTLPDEGEPQTSQGVHRPSSAIGMADEERAGHVDYISLVPTATSDTLPVYQEATAIQLHRATPRMVNVSPRSSISRSSSESRTSGSSDRKASPYTTHFFTTLPQRPSTAYSMHPVSPSSYNLDFQHLQHCPTPIMDHISPKVLRKPSTSMNQPLKVLPPDSLPDSTNGESYIGQPRLPVRSKLRRPSMLQLRTSLQDIWRRS